MTKAEFRFPPELLSQDIAIVGRKGSGKTYTAKGMVETLLTAKRRVCVVDPLGVWWGLRASADGKKAGFAIVVFGGARADVPINEHSGAALARIVATTNLPSIIDLSEMLIGQRHHFMTTFAEALYRENKTALHLVIDEADEFAPQQPLPETRRMLHQIDRIVRRGRVRGFRVMLITQRPAVLHKNVLTQANTLIAMRLTAPQDRNAINAWVEGQADKEQAKNVLGTLASLHRGEGWVWAPELNMLAREAFPKITTFDSSRSPEDDEVVDEPTKLAAVDISGITASFAAIETEAKTMADLKAEVSKLRKLASSAPAAVVSGHTEAHVQALVAAAVERERSKSRDLIASLVAIRDLAATASSEGRAQIAQPIEAMRAQAAPKAVLPPAVKVPAVASVGVSAPQQRILNAIAQLNAFGVEHPAKPMIGAHAGASPRSSGFTNNLSSLRTAGLVDYPGAGLVALTAAGRAKVPVIHKPTLRDLHNSWLSLLPRPQQAIVNLLIECHPHEIGKADLAQRIGVSSSSSGYTNNLSSLRTLGLLDYPAAGYVVATALLFPKGCA